MFPIQTRLLTPNKYSRPQTKLKGVKGVVIHWTANEGKGADAEANRRFFENRKSGRTGFGSAHYIVDSTEIVQCLPDSEMAYHVGATSYKTTRFGSYPNNCTLGIEMCVNSDGNFKVVYDQTVELTAALVKKYNLNPDTDIVRHFDVTGKNCPAYFTSIHWGKTNNSYASKYGLGSNADTAWKTFIAQVKAELNPKSAPVSQPKVVVKAAAKPAVSSQIGTIEVLVDSLNVRKDDSFSAPIAKVINKGERYKVYGQSNGMYNVGGGLWTSANAKYVKFTKLPTTKNYTVQKGDVLGRIAAAHKVTVEEILKVNPEIKDASLIQIGQVIKIPQ